jgi:hypothetical protein
VNKHIELVKKWLADPASVTQKELEDNRAAAHAAYDAYAADAAYDAYSAHAYAADDAAHAAHAAYDAYAADAAYWVKRYEELTK